ncbi:aspartate-ammonia ligase [Marinitoga hydrogenitolerans DSM 16785]|uniref:Aspartate-ammonia ligase n=1 Tax=Marinitoga hydrogenitolerans (strain DSM 16785 / JCM 12826 / AT1271) TaxID=1122195 RepID=A0A1M4WVG7_MARH1|nr:asparagine synthetase A [Marinitoga hydrogenitolerans]SHE85157.1 aspartate-ammonia ligase [Marinitoga hydrogenitolerans DSM 16785]
MTKKSVESMVRKVDTVELVKEYLENPVFKDATLVQSEILKSIRHVLDEKEFVELLPVTVSPITDPLNHPHFEAEFEYYGQKYSVTKSMILHKQVAVLVHKKIYIVSPNVRLETEDKMDSGRHLFDFVQIDMEMLEASREDVFDIMEDAIIHTIKTIKKKYPDIIRKYHPSLKTPSKPFKRYTVKELKEKYGERDYEKIASLNADEPFWMIDIPLMDREFYDKQDPKRPDVLLDFDLIYPEGFEEAISGGEREHEYEQILKRMKLKNTPPEQFEDYLAVAKAGILRHSAGCGIGIERFTRWVLALDHVEKTRLFAKTPGKHSI